MKRNKNGRVGLVLLLLGGLVQHPRSTNAWDSAAGNPTRPTHSLMTQWAIDQVQSDFPDVATHRQSLLDGANQELHELPVIGTRHGVDLEESRRQHRGTNAGCDDIAGWWKDATAAYRTGNKEKAYFLLGILLHMVEDMGVPAHANGITHQGTVGQQDNLEVLGLLNWKPRLDDADRTDPAYSQPWSYYRFSQEWTQADAPAYRSRTQTAKTWTFASREDRLLLQHRQGRTCLVVQWTLKSAAKAWSR